MLPGWRLLNCKILFHLSSYFNFTQSSSILVDIDGERVAKLSDYFMPYVNLALRTARASNALATALRMRWLAPEMTQVRRTSRRYMICIHFLPESQP